MESPVIPWKTFLDTLEDQQPNTMQVWLARWWFGNEGVVMADIISSTSAD